MSNRTPSRSRSRSRSPVYEPCSPVYEPGSPVYEPRSAVYAPAADSSTHALPDYIHPSRRGIFQGSTPDEVTAKLKNLNSLLSNAPTVVAEPTPIKQDEDRREYKRPPPLQTLLPGDESKSASGYHTYYPRQPTENDYSRQQTIEEQFPLSNTAYQYNYGVADYASYQSEYAYRSDDRIPPQQSREPRYRREDREPRPRRPVAAHFVCNCGNMFTSPHEDAIDRFLTCRSCNRKVQSQERTQKLTQQAVMTAEERRKVQLHLEVGANAGRSRGDWKSIKTG